MAMKSVVDVICQAHIGTIGAVSSMRELRESIRASNLENAIDAMKVVYLRDVTTGVSYLISNFMFLQEADIKKLVDECINMQGSLRQLVTEV